MAIAFVQSKSTNSGGTTSLALTYTNNVASASLLIAGMFDGGGINQADSVTDSVQGGNWNQDVTANLATDHDTVGIFSRVNATGGATTVTAHGTTVVGLAIHEYSGLATTTPLDKTQSNNATSGSATSNSTATTTSANELVFGLIGTSGSGDTVTAGSGYQARETDAPGHIATEDKIVSATGTYAATWTISPSDEYAALVATYAAPGGGGGGTTQQTLMLLGVGS